jgi:hypothetical protein
MTKNQIGESPTQMLDEFQRELAKRCIDLLIEKGLIDIDDLDWDARRLIGEIEDRCGDCVHWKPLGGDRGVSYATCFNEESSYCTQMVSSSCGCPEFGAFTVSKTEEEVAVEKLKEFAEEQGLEHLLRSDKDIEREKLWQEMKAKLQEGSITIPKGEPTFMGFDPASFASTTFGKLFRKHRDRFMQQDINSPMFMDLRPGAAQYVIVPPKGYGCLGRVFDAALKQAACGKGMERHGEDNTDYMEQTTMRDTKELGIGFPIGQGRKKGLEAVRLVPLKGVEQAKAEILGAINYYASAYLALDAGWAGEVEEDNEEW